MGRTAEEDALVRWSTRSHKEMTITKRKEGAAELAVTRRAAAEKTGSNMSRYDEMLEKSKANEVGFDKEDGDEMKE